VAKAFISSRASEKQGLGDALRKHESFLNMNDLDKYAMMSPFFFFSYFSLFLYFFIFSFLFEQLRLLMYFLFCFTHVLTGVGWKAVTCSLAWIWRRA
jgi:hypothetical protein